MIFLIGFVILAILLYRVERDFKRSVRELDDKFRREAQRIDELEERLMGSKPVERVDDITNLNIDKMIWQITTYLEEFKK